MDMVFALSLFDQKDREEEMVPLRFSRQDDLEDVLSDLERPMYLVTLKGQLSNLTSGQVPSVSRSSDLLW